MEFEYKIGDKVEIVMKLHDLPNIPGIIKERKKIPTLDGDLKRYRVQVNEIGGTMIVFEDQLKTSEEETFAYRELELSY